MSGNLGVIGLPAPGGLRLARSLVSCCGFRCASARKGVVRARRRRKQVFLRGCVASRRNRVTGIGSSNFGEVFQFSVGEKSYEQPQRGH